MSSIFHQLIHFYHFSWNTCLPFLSSKIWSEWKSLHDRSSTKQVPLCNSNNNNNYCLWNLCTQNVCCLVLVSNCARSIGKTCHQITLFLFIPPNTLKTNCHGNSWFSLCTIMRITLMLWSPFVYINSGISLPVSVTHKFRVSKISFWRESWWWSRFVGM